MADKEVKRIQLSRSAYIEESRSIAVIRLNEHYFLEGEPVIVNYYKEPDIRTDVGTIVAVGVHEGVGVDKYKIISTGQTVVVRKVVTDPADISSLVHKELYVFKNPSTGLWYYVFLKDGETSRTIQLIPKEDNIIFLETETGYRWFYQNQACRREDDFFSKSEIVKVINTIKGEDAYLSVEPVSGTVFKLGDVRDITFKINNYRLDGTNVSSRCKYYVNGEKIERTDEGYWTANEISGSTSFVFKSEYEAFPEAIIEYTKTVQVTFGHYTYFGLVYEGWTAESDSVKALSHKELHYLENVKVEGMSLNYQKVVFAYPASFGSLEHIFDVHRNDYIYDYTVEQVTVDDIPYLVYIKKDPTTISDFSQEFVLPFVINSGDSGGGSSEEIHEAWRKRNTPSGLVQLGKDGKLPKEILSGTTSNAVLFIESIRPDIPTSSSGPGLSYYVSSVKKIYTSKTTDEFHSSLPNDSVIYVNREDNIEYCWVNDQMIPLTNSLSISDITDLIEIL